MRNIQRSTVRARRRAQAGFSLIEVMVSVGIMTVIMGATMGALAQAMRANQTALLVTGMNNSLRTGMDLMIRDLLQVGSGLPTGHYVLIPSGDTKQVNLPGPPGTTYKSLTTDLDFNAVNPGPGLGPLVNLVGGGACATAGPGCVATDTITTLAADSTFNDVPLTARAANGTSITVDSTAIISTTPDRTFSAFQTGPDRVAPGQLMMLEKGSYAILVQVTSVNAAASTISFANGTDSLNLNRHTAPSGSMGLPCAAGGCDVAPLPTGLTAWPPTANAGDTTLPNPQTVPVTRNLQTTATRIRMISYYLDTTDPAHPRLVRRVNNGDPFTFDNTSGSTVAFDIDNLQISYDIANAANNPANVRFVAADYTTAGACAPNKCSVNQIRKVNITLSARSRDVFAPTKKFFHNALSTQISLRGMAFINEYTDPAP
jgi:prepilin-type N-terminal cleavage/methylation domain-containing protein